MTSFRRFTDVFPEFAGELHELLLAEGHSQLEEQIPELLVAGRCSCEDDFCATFYTRYEAKRRPFPDARSIEVHPKEGMVVLDVVSGKIAEIEVVYRDAIRTRPRALFP